MSDKGIRDKLGAIMDLHVLPDLPDSRAVWTTPFFLNGTRLASVGVQPGAEILETARSDNGDIEIRSPGSSAKITQRDIYACKVRAREGALAWKGRGFCLPSAARCLAKPVGAPACLPACLHVAASGSAMLATWVRNAGRLFTPRASLPPTESPRAL